MLPILGRAFSPAFTGRHLCTAVAVLLLGFVSGCGPDTGGRVPLGGTVTLGGAPLDRGTIEFHPVGEGSVTGGAILDGRFDIPATSGTIPGKYEVRIFATAGEGDDVPVGPPGPESEEPLQPELIDKRYNLESELNADVPAGGVSDLSFDLEA